jgi:hypothetical protein
MPLQTWALYKEHEKIVGFVSDAFLEQCRIKVHGGRDIQGVSRL